MKIIITIALSCLTLAGFSTTIEVGRDRLVNTLRKAIKMARDGDTILLHKGTYREGNIVIRKSICLIGLDNPVLDGENKHEILTVSGKNIIIRGIHFKNSGFSAMNDYASIKLVDAQFVTIENNYIQNAYFAIHVANSNNTIIAGNNIAGIAKTEQTSGNGIHLWKCDSMTVENNVVEGHRDGIYFEFVTNSYIDGNTSFCNIRYGLHFMFSNDDTYINNTFRENGAGVAVMYSRRVVMEQNVFFQNWGANAYGLLLKEISDAKITRNSFDKNTVGILMESTNRIEASLNNFENNGWALRIQASCDENDIHHNNFNANSFDVATNGTLTLNRFFNNYWDKYEGYDINKDGIGDIPYRPVSMYSMIIEQNPNAMLLMRSFMVTLLDKAERAIPSLTPENLIDEKPYIRRVPI
jgi:nitrous oxidase accessory protein